MSERVSGVQSLNSALITFSAIDQGKAQDKYQRSAGHLFGPPDPLSRRANPPISGPRRLTCTHTTGSLALSCPCPGVRGREQRGASAGATSRLHPPGRGSPPWATGSSDCSTLTPQTWGGTAWASAISPVVFLYPNPNLCNSLH